MKQRAATALLGVGSSTPHVRRTVANFCKDLMAALLYVPPTISKHHMQYQYTRSSETLDPPSDAVQGRTTLISLSHLDYYALFA